MTYILILKYFQQKIKQEKLTCSLIAHKITHFSRFFIINGAKKILKDDFSQHSSPITPLSQKNNILFFHHETRETRETLETPYYSWSQKFNELRDKDSATGAAMPTPMQQAAGAWNKDSVSWRVRWWILFLRVGFHLRCILHLILWVLLSCCRCRFPWNIGKYLPHNLLPLFY